jgi:hypothetical protein
MGTTWASVITEDALLVINDQRLYEELAENPALFFRKMAFYMQTAVPRFHRPPEIQQYLTYTAPVFDSLTFQPTEDKTAPFSPETALPGYDMMSAGIMTEDVYGNPVYTPTDLASYDSGTGVITIAASEEAPVAAGTVFSLDFYTDGTFDNELTLSQRRILALCLQEAWETAFANDWLNRIPRAKDRSFDAGNVANQTRANTERKAAVKRALDDALAAYEQNCAYMKGVKNATTFY